MIVRIVATIPIGILIIKIIGQLMSADLINDSDIAMVNGAVKSYSKATGLPDNVLNADTDREQDELNPIGVNVIRRFPGRVRPWASSTEAADAGVRSCTRAALPSIDASLAESLVVKLLFIGDVVGGCGRRALAAHRRRGV